MPIDPQLKEILVCPQCLGQLTENQAGDELICAKCRLRYRVEQDIPIMLPEEALPLED
jgi:uncharacterized protein YbaR (Trm112 family)